MSKRKANQLGSIGDVYGAMLNNVQVVKESKEKQEIGDSPLLKGGPETAEGWEEHQVDNKLNPDIESAYGINKLSYDEDEESTSRRQSSGFPSPNRKSERAAEENMQRGNKPSPVIASNRPGPSSDLQAKWKSHETSDAEREYYLSNAPTPNPEASDYSINIWNHFNMKDEDGEIPTSQDRFEDEEVDAEVDEEVNEELKEVVKESINNFMKNKKSVFDKLYEGVMFGDEDAGVDNEELDALGIDDEGEGEGDLEEVTLTLNVDVAKQLLELLQSAVGGEEGLEGGEEGLEGGEEDGFSGDFEED